jgi:hypothetical protein
MLQSMRRLKNPLDVVAHRRDRVLDGMDPGESAEPLPQDGVGLANT